MNQNTRHPKPARLEALVDGSLPEAEGATVASHVQTCERCAAEVEELRGLFAALADLPRMAPSAGFADRVMAGVRIAAAAATVHARPPLADRLRGLVPGRRLGWSLAAAFTGVPAVATAAALVWLASHPTLSAQALWIFATQRIAVAASAATGWVVETLAATRAAGWLGAFGRGLAAVEPGQLGVAAAVLLALSGLSAWVLYRNLIRTPTRERHHVSYSF